MKGTIEVPEKGQGADSASPTDKGKAGLIGTLRPKRMLKDLLGALQMPRGGHRYAPIARSRPDKYASIRPVISAIFAASKGRYGYRRTWPALKDGGVAVSEKASSRIMREDGPAAKRGKRRPRSFYSGELSKAP